VISISPDVEILEMFDFDWTLFRSPFPPEGTPEKTWWASPESLRPPYLPLLPPAKYWIEDSLRELRSSIRDYKRQPVIVTARRQQTRLRIEEILNQKGLENVPLFCRRSSFSLDRPSTYFKRSTVAKILKANPHINRLIVWEDTQKQIDELRELARIRKIKFHFNKVKEIGRRQ